jgi:predicted DsbA family dithiol-disulfide isomerase
MSDTGETVQFYFDPMCPWAYEASKWIREVRRLRDISVDWRFFSLETINREPGKKYPWERRWSYGWSMMRIAAYLRRQEPALVDTWYATNGRAFFEQGERVFTESGAADILERIGVDPQVVEIAISDPATTEDVRADHEYLATKHGGHGVPTLVFDDGQALFGPVLTTAPHGDDALALWELVGLYRRFPRLYELRRPKTTTDMEHVESFLARYLNTRAWRTVQQDPDQATSRHAPPSSRCELAHDD